MSVLKCSLATWQELEALGTFLSFFLPSLPSFFSLVLFSSLRSLHSLKCLLSTSYVSSFVPGAGDSGSKTDAVSALLSVESLRHRQREQHVQRLGGLGLYEEIPVVHSGLSWSTR